MKRIALTLVVLCFATSLFAGGKECDMKKHTVKTVELTGTLLRADAGDDAKMIFRVANSNETYTVCEKTKSAVLRLGDDGHTTLHVKGKIVSCGDGEELMIEHANKI